MFPLHAHDISKMLIIPFLKWANPQLMVQKLFTYVLYKVDLHTSLTETPTTVDMPHTTASFSFLFNYHKHRLNLVSVERDDELMICDVCVTPVSSPPYYECAPCRYFIHSTCYWLPKTFSPQFSSPLFTTDRCRFPFGNHSFKLYTTSKLDMDISLCRCDLCGLITNGRVYECVKCKMMVDVKCASLPSTIRHASHAHHTCKTQTLYARKKCYCCRFRLQESEIGYCCTSCEFTLHVSCAMLPASITMREWDRYHSLMLLSDAARDHPSDSICEEELHPKRCMYHCRQCDVSFHLRCLKTASGEFRNVKFGRQFKLNRMHPDHPLTFSCVTIKRRCDICNVNVYDCCGFECGLCYFVACLSCGGKELANKM